MRIFERWYFGLYWNLRLAIEGFWFLLEDFFKDYKFAWWNIWVSIIFLRLKIFLNVKWQGHSVTHPLLANPFLPHFQHRPQKTQKNKNMFPICSIWLVPNLFSTCSHQVPIDASMCGECIYIYIFGDIPIKIDSWSENATWTMVVPLPIPPTH